VTSESLWTALALVLLVEGLLPFLSPHARRRAVGQIAQLQDDQIRFFALLAIAAGSAMLCFGPFIVFRGISFEALRSSR